MRCFLPSVCRHPAVPACLPLLLCLLVMTLTAGCELLRPQYDSVPAPRPLREAAYRTAEKYIGMEYEWGGQDHYSVKGIDCSGLVVGCYREATDDTRYILPFDDAAVSSIHQQYSVPTEQPTRGDLVLMGGPQQDTVSHIAVLDVVEAGTVYFIDASTSGDFEGVEYRSYALDNSKIKSFARLLLLKRR